MVLDLEKPRVIELHVRMDCKGCVHKIKKAMHGIEGVYEVYIDIPQQKVTVVGRTDPEKIVKTIRRTRKNAAICSSESTDPPPPTEPAAKGEAPAVEASKTSNETPPAKAPPTEEPQPKESAEESPPPPQKKPGQKVKASPQAKDGEPKTGDELQMVHCCPHNCVHRESWNNPVIGPITRYEIPYYGSPTYYNYRPSPYVTRYAYMQSPVMDAWHVEREHNGYSSNRSPGNKTNIASMFSDENPNACCIV